MAGCPGTCSQVPVRSVRSANPVQSATPLFPVNPDVPLVVTLADSANLELIAKQLMTDAAMGDDAPHLARAAAYLGEMAQAIVHDLKIQVAHNSAA